jgi:predicted Fe-S protein YdhL (DUF1289 family)
MSITGLAGFKAEKARREAAAAERDRPKAQYFNWKHNKSDEKNTVYVRFLQEFDVDVDGYNETHGLPVMQVEHQAPGKQGYLRRANCTMESEGQCYACERHADDVATAPVVDGKKKLKGWGPKSNFYTWALVDYQDGEGPKPVVLSRSFNSSFVDDLIIEVESADGNKITDKMWKITKTGAKLQTTWKLREAKGVELYDDTDVEVLDLKTSVLRAIPYDEQAAYYGAVYKDGDPLDSDGDDSAEEAPKREVTGQLKW